MSLRAACASLALWIPAAALAEGRSEGLMDLLSRVPTEAIASEPGDWSELIFADIDAAARSLDPAPDGVEVERLATWGPYARVFGTFELGEAAGLGLEGAWEPLIGFGPLDVRAAAGFRIDRMSDHALLVRLDPEAPDRVGPALLASGYEEQTHDGVTAWARGHDLEIDPAFYDRANPFGGDTGRSSRVTLRGDLLVQSAGWPLLREVLDADGPKGHPDLPAFAAALDDPAWGEARLLQAALLPHQADLATGRGGMPPWRVGLLADLGTGREAVALALFSYGTRLEADRAARHLAETWDEPVAPTTMETLLTDLDEPLDLDALEPGPLQPSFRERTGAEAVTGVAGEGPFVAWVALRTAPVAEGFRIRNPGFLALWMGVLNRNLTILGPP